MRRKRGWGEPSCGVVVACLALADVIGCGGPRAPEPAAVPTPAQTAARLAVDIVYPEDSQFVAARDSTFVFGNVSDPGARLVIGGQAVDVHPNGAFLAWVEIPREAGDTSALFEATARTDRDTVTARRWVYVPRRPPLLPLDRLAVDSTSVQPRGIVWALPDEALRISVRATSGAQAWVEWPTGERHPLAERPPRARNGIDVASQGSVYAGTVAVRSPLGRGHVEPARVPAPSPADTAPADSVLAERRPVIGIDAPRSADTARASADTLPRAILLLAREADTLRLPLRLDLWRLHPAELPVVEARDPPSAAGADGIVYGRPTSSGTYVWFFHDGQRLSVSGRENGRLRVQLAPDLHAWIDRAEQRPLPAGTPPPRARVGTISLEPLADRVDVRLALTEPVPYLVTEDGRRIELTLYSAYAETDWVYYGESDAFVKEARWRQEPGGIFVLTLDLKEQPWGYRVRYTESGLVWTVRRPPVVDRRHPLRGRRIAVDPGHPPAGARGPTRLYEGDVNLAIALRLKAMLEEEGAEVVLTRHGVADSVALYARPMIAESANAEILVSIHNNAFPDGVRPFDRHGTMVFYFHPHSLDLTRALQAHLLRELGLRDLGIGRANLALARASWMPAALSEGAFLMIPEQEMLLRTPRYQERYARGVLQGIEEFLRRRARHE